MHAGAVEAHAALRRARPLALLAVAALLLHALLLAGLPWRGADTTLVPGPALQVRTIASAFTLEPAEPQGPAALAGESAAAPMPVPLPAARPAPQGPRGSLPPVVPPPSPAADGPTPAMALPAPVPLRAAPPMAGGAADLADADLPGAESTAADAAAAGTYPTRLPGSSTLQYELRRGSQTGRAQLQWRLDGLRYEATLTTELGGRTLLRQSSQGVVDAAGVAPQRFTDQRLRRPAVAANFQREAGLITFSATPGGLPLHAGVQDRLSWMLQLAAVAAAAPERLAAGAEIVLQVVGARGEGGVWVFRSAGRDSIGVGGRMVDAVRLVRAPRSLYDAGLEVWLDPQREHLPLRVLVGAALPGREPLEWLLQERPASP
jgi:hypothetical protein